METSSEQSHLESKKFVSTEESKKIAQELLSKYESEISAQAYKDINGWNQSFVTEQYQNAIEYYMREIPKETLEHYYGHGITRGRDLEWLTAALNVLSNEGVRGDVSKLVGSGFIDAYTHGSFLVILKKDDAFPGGKPQKPDETGLFKINLGALIVNTKFYPLIDEMRRMFPKRTIIKANEIPHYFEQQNKS
jgi:hypothetical protein